MSLTAQLSQQYETFLEKAPSAIRDPIIKAREEHEASFDRSAAIQVGQKLPSFTLPNATGTSVSSAELLSKGPILITFYRGEWCPFCNMSLIAWQKHLDQINAHGVTLVAITPELPNNNISTTEKHELKFQVLSDIGNEYAEQLGIMWQQPDSMRAVFDKFGHDLPKRNGDDSMKVPVPATMLVDSTGVVKNLYLEPNYTKRVEPSEALKWIEALQQG